jgi:hypothetical protein
MSVKVSTNDLLLDALLGDPNIKAAMIIDDRGYIIEKRGSAFSLKGDDPTLESASARVPKENLYLVEAGENFLIVVFDEKLNFERIKKSVDDTLGQFDMAPVAG